MNIRILRVFCLRRIWHSRHPRVVAAASLLLLLSAAGVLAQGGLPGFVVLPLVLVDRSN